MYPRVQHKKPVWAYIAAFALLAVLVFVENCYFADKSHELDLEQANHQQAH
jgi:hypothetical protein